MQTPATPGGRGPPATICRGCHGSGKVRVVVAPTPPGQPQTVTMEKCPRCGGSGQESKGGYLTK